jgi:hypothetical protein
MEPGLLGLDETAKREILQRLLCDAHAVGAGTTVT